MGDKGFFIGFSILVFVIFLIVSYLQTASQQRWNSQENEVDAFLQLAPTCFWKIKRGNNSATHGNLSNRLKQVFSYVFRPLKWPLPHGKEEGRFEVTEKETLILFLLILLQIYVKKKGTFCEQDNYKKGEHKQFRSRSLNSKAFSSKRLNAKTYFDTKYHDDLPPWITRPGGYCPNPINQFIAYPLFNQEIPRLISYRTFPSHLVPLSLSFILLANAGFYYPNREAFVQCYGCEKLVNICDFHSDPADPEYHEENCAFVKRDTTTDNDQSASQHSLDSGHINANGIDSINNHQIETDSALSPQQATPSVLHGGSKARDHQGRSIQFNDLSSGPSAAAKTSYQPGQTNVNVCQVSLEGSRYPQFCTHQKRLDSFTRCHEVLVHKPNEYADAGMFYADYSDCVRCFHCGLGLKSWKRGDDIDEMHKKYREDCAFLKMRLTQKEAEKAEAQTNLSAARNDTIQSRPKEAKSLTFTLLEKEKKKLKETVTCKICKKQPVKDLFLPCGDLHACAECSKDLTNCPSCQTKILATVNVYLI